MSWKPSEKYLEVQWKPEKCMEMFWKGTESQICLISEKWEYAYTVTNTGVISARENAVGTRD